MEETNSNAVNKTFAGVQHLVFGTIDTWLVMSHQANPCRGIHAQLKNMAPQLQDLPDELLVDILGYLPKSDLKSARLTCARYGHIGAQWLFQRVYFAPHMTAMDTFLNISANPSFARTVTELVYDARLFLLERTTYQPYKRAFDAYWEDHAQNENAREGDGSNMDVDVNSAIHHEYLANSLVNYTRLFDQQQSIFENQKDYEALLLGFKNFPNITTVIVLDIFSEGRDSVPLRRDDHSWYHQCSERQSHMPIKPSSWRQDTFDENAYQHKWNVSGILNLIRAVSKQGQNVKELHIASETSSAPTTIFEMGDDLYNGACTMAQRLTSLKMDLHLFDWDLEKERLEQYHYLQVFLSEAKELRCLAISGRVQAHVLMDKYWPHLETLHLGNIALNAKELKAITHAHKRALRELTLRNLYIVGEEGWSDAAKEIGKYLRLRRVSVLDVCDEVTREETESPYLDDETNLAVARSFMQSIPRTTLLDEYPCTIIACPQEGEVGDSNGF